MTTNPSRQALKYPENEREFLEKYLPQTSNAASDKNRPFVTLTYATSLDSQISLSPGTQTVLSGPKSKAMTHYLRSRHDAILIGVGTAVADDPGLNCRLEGVGGFGGRGLEGQPRSVIIDPDARWDFTQRSKMFIQARQHHSRAPFILTAVEELDPKKQQLLESLGGKFIHIPARAKTNNEHEMEWTDILAALKHEGLNSVMIEGGRSVINTLLSKKNMQLIDSVIITIAPTWLGQGGVVVSPNRRIQAGNAIPAARLIEPVWHQLGEDVVLAGKLGL
jgi:2,5-diamino-6-(ribosylamino)-4(3H)-pyrimidinone 5'-phosphate reductase